MEIAAPVQSRFVQRTVWQFRSAESDYPLYSDFLSVTTAAEHYYSVATIREAERSSRGIALLESLSNADTINDTFRQLNKKMEQGTLLYGFAITCAAVKEKWKNKYRGSWKLFYLFFFLWHRCFPKLSPGTNKFYNLIRNGFPRYMTRPEILGRLYCCGFEIVQHEERSGVIYFIARKLKQPLPDAGHSYWPLFKMKRIGANGKTILVHKFRTMHPYAEFLQDYMKVHHGLGKGGKYKDDFRVTYWGKKMRKYWLDELPMLYDLLCGRLKLIGVRPISSSYFNMYPPELKTLRLKHKPGLIPPFYLDMPETLEEIVQSEMKYLTQYEGSPIRTDLRYSWGIFKNILFRRKTSA